MSERMLMGIDLGTSGVKVALFDEKGARICSCTEEYPLSQPRNGWAEQNPEDWWHGVQRAVRTVLDGIDGKSAEIAGIGLSGQMHGLVMLGEDGRVLRPAILWCDQRTAKECEEITARVGKERLMELTMSPALTGFTASKILWVRNHEPQIYEKCRKILLPKDYIRYRLTGELATDVSDASGMQLLDIAHRDWSGEVLQKLEIDRSLLGKVYESPEVTGQLSREAAEVTGLRVGTPVVGGAGDNAAAAIGCGVVRDGDCFTTIGTSGVVFAHSSALRGDPRGRIHSFCAAVPGEYHVMGVTLAAGLSLRWFRDCFCREEKEEADSEGVDVYRVMDEEASAVPIGANRLLYLPYLMGERTPHLDPYARGAFVGLSASHSRADCLRAVMEGVTFSLRDALGVFEECRVDVRRMMACGGGAVSPLWRQMLADVFGCPVNTAVSGEGGALGAALLAGVGTGVYSSVFQACDAVIRIRTEQEPDIAAGQAYMPYYQLYRQLYAALHPTWDALASL